ncbi:hypothetical protein AVEN_113365-1 [Araneus ventricosus]|uniref:Uncharacterized protein n=1 Tax=Araneus ventricosus TaxID=182803 RepID=A0A4Y2IRU1_ARAVE|nr:hypothetical protein AVEN_113365-1 [Araneus ventricosus]
MISNYSIPRKCRGVTGRHTVFLVHPFKQINHDRSMQRKPTVHKVLKTVNLKPVFLTCEEILFVIGHGSFPSIPKRFHLSDSDSCACGEVGYPIHYATSCPLTLPWRIIKPSTSLERLWYQRVLVNPNSIKRIINTIKFIIDNENIIRLE